MNIKFTYWKTSVFPNMLYSVIDPLVMSKPARPQPGANTRSAEQGNSSCRRTMPPLSLHARRQEQSKNINTKERLHESEFL
jgi:hypothetical protein